MGNKEDSIVLKKAFAFAIRKIELTDSLKKKKQFELAGQLIRSGTSIWANINEALGGVSRKDFIHKMSIAYKESNETQYWLKLISAANILPTDNFLEDLTEIQKILSSIIITSKNNTRKLLTFNF